MGFLEFVSEYSTPLVTLPFLAFLNTHVLMVSLLAPWLWAVQLVLVPDATNDPTYTTVTGPYTVVREIEYFSLWTSRPDQFSQVSEGHAWDAIRILVIISLVCSFGLFVGLLAASKQASELRRTHFLSMVAFALIQSATAVGAFIAYTVVHKDLLNEAETNFTMSGPISLVMGTVIGVFGSVYMLYRYPHASI